jgi:hypothetical protein
LTPRAKNLPHEKRQRRSADNSDVLIGCLDVMVQLRFIREPCSRYRREVVSRRHHRDLAFSGRAARLDAGILSGFALTSSSQPLPRHLAPQLTLHNCAGQQVAEALAIGPLLDEGSARFITRVEIGMRQVAIAPDQVRDPFEKNVCPALVLAVTVVALPCNGTRPRTPAFQQRARGCHWPMTISTKTWSIWMPMQL